MTVPCRPIVLEFDDGEFTHRLSAHFGIPGRASVRRELVSRRRVLPLVPVYDKIVDEQAAFTLDDLYSAMNIVIRPLPVRLQLFGIPLAYYEEVREVRASGSGIRVVVAHATQGRLQAFFCRCYATLHDLG